MARVVALVDDLFFQARMLETARQVGVELKTVTTADALLRETQQDSPKLVLVDLNARSGALEVIARLRTASGPSTALRVIAFLSHVQTDLAERARAAGCQQVMPRSKFSQHLAAILSQAKLPSGE